MAKIIIAEDEDVSRFIIKSVVSKMGHSVYVCKDGMETFDLIYANSKWYDMILTDIRMPNLNGTELAKRIKVDLKLTIPIIAITAYPRELFKSDQTRWFDGWLIKPYEPEDIEKIMNEHLSRGEQTTQRIENRDK